MHAGHLESQTSLERPPQLRGGLGSSPVPFITIAAHQLRWFGKLIGCWSTARAQEWGPTFASKVISTLEATGRCASGQNWIGPDRDADGPWRLIVQRTVNICANRRKVRIICHDQAPRAGDPTCKPSGSTRLPWLRSRQ